MVRATSAWTGAVVLGCAAVIVALALSAGAHAVVTLVVGLFAVGCIAAGPVRRRVDRRAWIAIGAGIFCFSVHDAVGIAHRFILHTPTPYLSVATVVLLVGYLVLIVGIARLGHLGEDLRGAREAYADAGIVTAAVLAISWTCISGAFSGNPSLDALDKAAAFGAPLLDCGIVYVVLRGLVFGRHRATYNLLAAAVVALGASDVAYDVLSKHGPAAVGGGGVAAGRLVSYVLIGAAALFPAGRDEPLVMSPVAAVGADRASRRRLPIIALAGFVAPAILATGASGGDRVNTGTIAATSVIIFALVVLRMRWTLERIDAQTRSLEQALALRDGLERELRRQASHDSLTGLANRELLHSRVEQALARAGRQHGGVAVCFCDLDRFKMINDSMGHAVGDALLVAAARRITSTVRPSDTVARLGGDEFAVLMEDIDALDEAVVVAERIVAALREPFDLPEREIRLSVSVGVAVATLETSTAALLSEADQAMYAAKRGGRDRFALFEKSMRIQLMHEMELTARFPGALERSEFFLEYQPQFTLATDQLAGYEALLRWRHPTLGVVAPGRFISVAEEMGHIQQLGIWALEQACFQTAEWARLTGAPLTIAVNISGLQLQDASLFEAVDRVVASTGLDPEQLILEITESVLVLKTDESLRALAALKSLGVRLAIDDFGTGYSSLNYLRHFPIDELKIDKSFVDTLTGREDDDYDFIDTIMKIAASLGLETVAEGIESPVQRQQLAALGCDRGQGYLLGRPLDITAATRFAQAYASNLFTSGSLRRGAGELATIGAPAAAVRGRPAHETRRTPADDGFTFH